MSYSSAKLSFEFFPPKNETQQAGFDRALSALAALSPEYMSVTFGAGGSTRSRTREAVQRIRQSGVEAAPHISCMSEDTDTICELLDAYQASSIRRLVVLRGDRPSGGGSGVFDHAIDLVRFIRQHYADQFHIEVACYPEHHPESKSPETDLIHFKEKVQAGADGAITQYFFTIHAWEQFMNDCQRLDIDVPITPGIMPITNYSGLARFSKLCGAEIPAWIGKRLAAWEAREDFDSIRDFGVDVVTDLCHHLLNAGAPGIHIYTLNRARASLAICRQLGLGRSD
ncbi:MAG: methylenetetrahydrofolate reductase [NAD(P)H] [Pseudomonadota bacterium]